MIADNKSLYDTPNGKDVSLGYQAVQDVGRRQASRTTAHNEDRTLKPKMRKRLEETATDQARNYAIAAWMIRRHLDYVSRFAPSVKTGFPDLDKAVKALLREQGKRRNFDVAGKFSRDQAMRFFELHKVLEGDAAFVLLRNGKHQIIEGRMIGKPDDLKDVPKAYRNRINDHGLIVDPNTGELKAACVLRWNDAGDKKVYGRIIKADDLVFDAYYPRVNSSRGVSPLSTSINPIADLYESVEATAIKIKLHALFGVAITRKGTEFGEGGFEHEEDEEYNVPESGAQEVDFSKGAAFVNLDPGEDLKTIESTTPNSQFVDFSSLVIRLAMLSLDIAYTAFDSSKASFSARIADRQEYEFSAGQKRQKNQEVLEELTAWDVRRWAADDSLLGQSIRDAGVDVDHVIRSITWDPIGAPWLDKLKEVLGDERAIALGLDSTPRAARRRGLDAYDILEEEAEFRNAAKAAGVSHVIGVPGQQTVEEKRIIEEAATSAGDDE